MEKESYIRKTPKMILKTIKVLIVVLACLIAFTNVIGAASQKYFNTPLPMLGGYGYAIVLSGSMEPSLSINDMVLFHEENEYHAGDIIVFEDEGDYSVHRIEKINKDIVVTQGDANVSQDKERPIECIIGKVPSKQTEEGEKIVRIPWVGKLYEPLPTAILIFLVLLIAFTDTDLVRKETDNDESEE